MEKLNKDWIIGFSEGEGSWFSRKNNSRGFEIGQDKSDSQILYRIKGSLGYGKVYHNTQTNLSRYVMLTDQAEMIYTYYNGHFRMQKTLKRFTTWAENLAPKNLNIQQEIKVTALEDNAWLSGFIDAEGCFRIAEDKGRGKVIFEISQKEREILEKIAEFLKLKNNIYLDRGTYVLATSSQDARKRLKKYINKYPLKTKKRIAFNLWSKADNLAKRQELKGEKLEELRAKFNK